MADAQPLAAYASAQARNQDQQRALLASIAESGSAGAQAYQQAQSQNQALQQGALQQASGLGAGPGSQLENTLALNQGAMNNAQQSFTNDIARQSANNADYMAQVGAAVPIAQERSRISVEQIIADAQQKREQNALALQQAQLGLQGTQLSLQGQREQNAADAAKAAAAAANGGLTPYEKAQIDNANADNARADKDRADKAAADAATMRDQKRMEAYNAFNARTGTVDGKGNVIPTQASLAVQNVVRGFMTVDEALKTFHTPAGKPLDRNYVQSQVDLINRAGG